MSSCALLHALLRGSSDLIWAKDLAGRYIACNPLYTDYIGLPEAAIIGKADADLPLGERAIATPLDPQALSGSGTPVDELWLTWPDGARRGLVQIRALPLRAEAGALIGTLLVAHEITALHEAQAALHASKDHYGLLFTSLVLGVVYHAGDGTIIDANPAACTILGLTADQLAGRTSLDPRWHAIHEDGSPFPGSEHPAMLALRSGQAVHNVIMGVFNPANEAYSWITINAVPQLHSGDAAPYQVCVTFEDITAQRRAQDELVNYRRHLEQLVAERTAALEAANRRLRRSDARLQALLDLSQRASTLAEPELLEFAVNEAVRLAKSTIGYLHCVNDDQESIELLIWSVGAHQGCTATPDRHYPLARAGIWAEAVRSGRPVIHNNYQQTPGRRGYPQGHVTVQRHMSVPVLEGGKVRLLLGVGNKATDYDESDAVELWLLGVDLWRIIIRHRVEAALRESEARYKALFEASTDALALLDVATGQFIDCNAAAISLFGTDSREELLGRRPEEFAPEHQPCGARSAELASEQLARGADSGSALFEWLSRKRDGSLVPMQVSLSAVQFQGRAHLLLIGRDIGPLKRHQAELEQARDAAEAANRAKSTFLATMSHELRTPLSAILGRAELMREQIYGPLNPLQQAALSAIEASGARLLNLINELLDLSRIEAGQIRLSFELVPTAQLGRDALEQIGPAAAARRITLAMYTEGPACPIMVDPRRFGQILVNLLVNAIKFTPEGGQAGLTIRIDPAAGTVTFVVWDTGIGIDPANLPHLFQPFMQVDTRLSREYEGSGLGLALVQRLAQLHGGSVAVESRLGEGSRFSVTVPLPT